MIWINLLRFRASVRTRSGADALGDGYPGGTDPIGVLTGVPAARGSGSFLTRRWRETDSNHRSLATSPSLSHAQIDVAARHYEGHALEHRHVVKRARIHSDHIGRFA
jgi:hypothetical protein